MPPFTPILSDLQPVRFLPAASVSFALILLFVIPPNIPFCTRPLLRPLPSAAISNSGVLTWGQRLAVMYYRPRPGIACAFSLRYHLVKYRKGTHTTGVRTTLSPSHLERGWLCRGCWCNTPGAGIGLSVRTFRSFVNVRPNAHGRSLENLNKQMKSVRCEHQSPLLYSASGRKMTCTFPFP